MFFQTVRDRDETPDEHARVPAILTAVDVFERSFVIRFLHEPFGLVENGFGFLRAGGRGQFRAGVNVAVTGFRTGRFDADGHDRLTLRGDIKGVGQNLLELFRIRNDVVGGQHGHHARGRTRADERRAECHRRARIATHRLGNDVIFRQLGQLFPHLGDLRGVGDDENVLGWHERQHALDGFLQKGFFAEQGE